jgi:hypothetical protein
MVFVHGVCTVPRFTASCARFAASRKIGAAIDEFKLDVMRGGPDKKASIDGQRPCAWLLLNALFRLSPWGVLQFCLVTRVAAISGEALWVGSRKESRPFRNGVHAFLPTKPAPHHRALGAPSVPIEDFQTLVCWSALTPTEQEQLEPVPGTTVVIPIWLLLIMVIG